MAVTGPEDSHIPPDTHGHHPPHLHYLVRLRERHMPLMNHGLHSIVVYYYATLAGALKEVNKDLRLQLHVV